MSGGNLREEEGEDALKGEEAFKKTKVLPWTKQITVRSVVTSFVLSIVFNFIVCKLNLTTGVIPSLNVAAGLLGFAVLKSYTAMLRKLGLAHLPFTRQENTVIQTCVVASSGIAFSSGTASYLLGMSPYIAAQGGGGGGGDTPINTKTLNLKWMFGFLFAVSFVGLFSILPLRKMMILKYKLTYPSGTATAHLINSFHTPKGAKLAKKQVSLLFKSFCGSFLFALFQWFFAAADESIISWGGLWPWIAKKKGIWYSADLIDSSLHGLQGYKVFIAIAMILGDGVYHCVYMLTKTGLSLVQQYSHKKPKSEQDDDDEPNEINQYDDKIRTDFFLKDQIPMWVACTGYTVLAIVSILSVSHIFPQLKWYHILVAYLIAPVLAFCNSYGCGLTDWSLASNYGKIAILIFSGWVGLDSGGVVAGLASCGVMMSIVSTASDLMQDFKTGYLTLASPRSMFFSQILGTAMGCVITPPVFWFFYKAYTIGDPDGSYPAPFGQVYRGISLLGVEGFSSLPKNCLELAILFFFLAILINVVHDLLRRYETRYGVHRFVPNAMCLAIPFYLGGYFAIDMCVGSLILYVWERRNKRKAEDFCPALASGLICGESLWGIPAAILALAGLKAPLCMKFLSAPVNDRVQAFLDGAR
ncbi:putative metal-nicotianamine transporter YSL7 [Senna tora]|uniref:Putative metal-nicotianamine transporter YSL7 n=1 Tax=Senna tora TaxID=362788 RepID=A0A834SQ06_9FABA|nr:putative metal-nicotianamine transporter YSL7 [Senna tora]